MITHEQTIGLLVDALTAVETAREGVSALLAAAKAGEVTSTDALADLAEISRNLTAATTTP